MKKSLLLVPLVLSAMSAIALPARANDITDAYLFGQRQTELLCVILKVGQPRNLTDAYYVINQIDYYYNRTQLIQSIKETRGDDDPVVQAYETGVMSAISPCFHEIEKLSGK
jgi:hypothetical protein